jgi:hypothetical protein
MAALRGPSRQLLVARLEHLEKAGLAERKSPGSWTLADGWQGQLRDLGIRNDIIKLMYDAMPGDTSRYRIVKPGQGLSAEGEPPRPVTGRIAGKGLSDELKGAFYAVVETPDGRGYHLPIPATAADTLRIGDVVTLETKPESPVRPIDRKIAERAAANHGLYVIQPSARDPSPDEQRMRELERLGVVSQRRPSAWHVPPDLVARIEQQPRRGPPRQLVLAHKEPMPLSAQIPHPGLVWLDKLRTEELAPYGFGAELRRMVAQRRDVLRGWETGPDDPNREAKFVEVRMRAIGKEIADRTGERMLEHPPSGFRGRVQVFEGREGAPPYAVVSDGSRFVLVEAGPGVRAAQGRMVTFSRDEKGRMVVRGDRDRDRGL